MTRYSWRLSVTTPSGKLPGRAAIVLAASAMCASRAGRRFRSP